jgi:hypothetical protein
MAFFYEIRSAENAVLKRDGGFATQDAAKTAGREDAKRMKNSRQPDRPHVGTILVGQNAEKARGIDPPFNSDLMSNDSVSVNSAIKDRALS